MVFLILYVDDILMIGNDFEMLAKVKIQLATQFQMKDLGEEQCHAPTPTWVKIRGRGT